MSNCPICSGEFCQNLLSLKTGNFDQSTLYDEIKIKACSSCGHVFNQLNANELSELLNYYLSEKKLTNLNSQDKRGDLPGSNNPLTISRYEKLFDFLQGHLKSDAKILDIGFCQGGFINFLRARGYQDLTDLDVVDSFLAKDHLLNSLPFADQSVDFIIMDQALEHLHNPREAIRELGRVLKPDALLYLGLPDASRYAQNNFFDFFWFLLREHIQHFDLSHLRSLLTKENFALVDYLADDTVMMNEQMLLPNLHCLFRLTEDLVTDDSSDQFDLLSKTKSYVATSQAKFRERQEFFQNLSQAGRAIYVWGMGREFLYLYEAAGLKTCNIQGLIDTNPFKQSELTVANLSVSSSELVKNIGPDSYLLITAIAHIQAIQASLEKQNYHLNYLALT